MWMSRNAFLFKLDRNLMTVIRSVSLNSKEPEVIATNIADADYLRTNPWHAALSQPKRHVLASDMNEYLTKYGYDTSNPIILRALSALHTYPLTLSFGINAILSSPISEMNVAIIGARAESMLPVTHWKNTLIASYKIHRVQLYLQGPHLHKSTLDAVVDWNHGGGCEQNRNVSLTYLPKGPLFHQDTSAISLLSSLYAIALFNPGFGHAYLQQSWAPTLKYLYTCKIPILCTALSQHDLDRELDWLHQLNIEQSIQFEFVMKPLLNPFRSLRLAIDDKEKDETNRIIGTNQYVYIIKGK